MWLVVGSTFKSLSRKQDIPKSQHSQPSKRQIGSIPQAECHASSLPAVICFWPQLASAWEIPPFDQGVETTDKNAGNCCHR